MYIEFPPTAKTREKIKKILRLRAQGMKWDDVAKEMGHGKRYLLGLVEYYKSQKGKNVK